MSAPHVHHLWGCAPTPLAHYLKALGILRIVSEQKDSTARGWWQDEHFCLLTRLDRTELEQFFLNEYAPTAMVSPWNRGSGFFTPNDKGLSPLEASTAPRFAPFRDGIVAARSQSANIGAADQVVRDLKDRTKAKKGMTEGEKRSARSLKSDLDFKRELAAAERVFADRKVALLADAQREWRGTHREWMDAALVVTGDGVTKFPSLLGTGGSDGRLDFTNNLMQRFADLFDLSDASGRPLPRATALLEGALWSAATNDLSKSKIGQFLPGDAGGANMTTGPDAESHVNAWDFVLMLEGSVCLSARATRRLDSEAGRDASAPFALRADGAGVATFGREKAGRGEQWMPLWLQPATLNDIRAMIGDGRVQIGRQTARRPMDASRAIARVGVARGIQGFVRYGYLERNGQSNLAVPLGRVDVGERPHARVADDLAQWLPRLHRIADEDHCPPRLRQAEHALSNSLFGALTRNSTPGEWQTVLRAAAAIEAIQCAGTGFEAGPIPPLSPDWLDAADDGSPEWRLAMALGSASTEYRKDGRPVDSIREHVVHLTRSCLRFETSDKRLAHSSRIVMLSRDPIADLCALLNRRVVESSQRGDRHLRLVAATGYEASIGDLSAFVAGNVDVVRVVELGRALTALQWRRVPGRRARGAGADQPPAAWSALRLATLAWPLDRERNIPVEPALLRRITGGDGSGALSIALRRLRAAGFRPPLRTVALSPEIALRFAAALAFPISRYAAGLLARSFEPTTRQESR